MSASAIAQNSSACSNHGFIAGLASRSFSLSEALVCFLGVGVLSGGFYKKESSFKPATKTQKCSRINLLFIHYYKYTCNWNVVYCVHRGIDLLKVSQRCSLCTKRCMKMSLVSARSSYMSIPETLNTFSETTKRKSVEYRNVSDNELIDFRIR